MISKIKYGLILLLTLVILSYSRAEQNFNDLSVDYKPSLVTNYYPPSASAQSYNTTNIQVKQKQNEINNESTDIELNKESKEQRQENIDEEQQAEKTYHYDSRTDTIRDGKSLISNNDKLKPLCKLSPEKFTRIKDLIEDQAIFLFDRSIPEIDFNFGSRVESFDGGESGNTISPGVSASISFPLYQPDADASRAEKQQAYLTQCLTNLNILENNWYAYQTLSKKRDIQKKIMSQERDISMLDSYFKNENEMTQLISNMNQAIRYLDIMLKVKIESWQ